jgi:hypothetical protein
MSVRPRLLGTGTKPWQRENHMGPLRRWHRAGDHKEQANLRIEILEVSRVLAKTCASGAPRLSDLTVRATQSYGVVVASVRTAMTPETA